MTTGSTPTSRVWKTDPRSGQLYFDTSRTWNGGDSASTYVKHARTYHQVWTSPKYNKRGILIKQPAFVWKRDQFTPPPKKARNREQHPYTTLGSRVRQDSYYMKSNDGYDLALFLSTNIRPLADPWTSNDDLKLLDKLRDRIAGSSFNAGVVLGEGKKTLQMIGDNAISIAKAIKFARRGNFASAADVLLQRTGKKRPPKGTSPIASNWLELQYGWMPLLSDISDGMMFIHHQLESPNLERIVVTRNAGGLHAGVSQESGRHYTDLSQTYYLDNHYVESGKRIIALIKEVNNVQLSGILDPLSVGWELLPYSFVADWFLPIGSYLAARGLAQSVSGTFITTKRFRSRYTGPLKYQNAPTGRQWTIYGQTAREYLREQWSLDRSISTTLSVPLPSFKPLEKVASWQHAANAVALVISAGRGFGHGVAGGSR